MDEYLLTFRSLLFPRSKAWSATSSPLTLSRLLSVFAVLPCVRFGRLSLDGGGSPSSLPLSVEGPASLALFLFFFFWFSESVLFREDGEAIPPF